MIKGFPMGALALIDGRFPLTEKDPGAFRRFKLGAGDVRLQWHEARGLGNVAALTLVAAAGLSHRHMLVINPRERDAPLFTFEALVPLGRRTLVLELYDTAAQPVPRAALAGFSAVKASLAALPDHDVGATDTLKLPPCLAKRGGKGQETKLDEAAWAYLEAYLALCAAAPPAAPGNGRVAAYVSDLLGRDGPATAAFKRHLGEERTHALFEGIVYGVRSRKNA